MGIKQTAMLFVGSLLFVGYMVTGVSSAQANSANSSEGITYVAGAENVVMDRREKNNTSLISIFILAGLAFLVLGALRHAQTKISDKK